MNFHKTISEAGVGGVVGGNNNKEQQPQDPNVRRIQTRIAQLQKQLATEQKKLADLQSRNAAQKANEIEKQVPGI